MANKKITELAAITGAQTAAGDLIELVDVSDTSMAASGTNKKITRDELSSVMGAVASVNGQTGTVVLDAGDVGVAGALRLVGPFSFAFDTANISSATGIALFTPAIGDVIWDAWILVRQAWLADTSSKAFIGTWADAGDNLIGPDFSLALDLTSGATGTDLRQSTDSGALAKSYNNSGAVNGLGSPAQVLTTAAIRLKVLDGIGGSPPVNLTSGTADAYLVVSTPSLT